VKIATATGIGGSVFTSQSFLGGSGAWSGSIGGWWGRFLAITAVDANPLVVYLTSTTVRLAAVTFHAQQLNVGWNAGSAAGKGHDVIIFQVHGAATALTNATVSRENNFFGCFRDIPALRETTESNEEQRQQ
jgi:hypothetical protein